MSLFCLKCCESPMLDWHPPPAICSAQLPSSCAMAKNPLCRLGSRGWAPGRVSKGDYWRTQAHHHSRSRWGQSLDKRDDDMDFRRIGRIRVALAVGLTLSGPLIGSAQGPRGVPEP